MSKRDVRRRSVQTPTTRQPKPKAQCRTLVVIAVLGTIAYSNSFFVPFHFDDRIRIEENPLIRTLWPISVPTADTTRPFCMLTFAVNYAVGGHNVLGYHVVNLAIHIVAGWLLFGIARRTLLLPPLARRYERHATGMALVIALIWTLHPINTEAVTYVVQRLESLMGMLFLATLYCLIRGFDASRSWGWLGVSIGCSALGMATKETMFTAPLLVIWYDRVFLASSWKTLWQARQKYYIGLFSTWLVLAWCMWRWQEEFTSGMIGSVKGVTPLSYLLTQAGVIVHYLRLSLWPFGLCLDYGWPVARTAWEIVPPLIVVGSLFVATLVTMFYRPRWGFVGGWFFCTLAPTSSFVPINDMAFEHRMYLPLIAVVVGLVILSQKFSAWLVEKNATLRSRLSAVQFALAAIVVVQMTIVAWGRNEVYRTKLGLWEDTVAKAPLNSRAHSNYAAELRVHGRLEESYQHCKTAVELAPYFSDAQTNLGVALMDRGDLPGSIKRHTLALKINPKNQTALSNLAVSLWKSGDREAAKATFDRAEALGGFNVELSSNFAKLLAENGMVDEAIKHYQSAIAVRPNDASLYYNAGVAMQDAARFEEAAGYYRQALKLAPDLEQAHNNLGITMVALGKPEQAVACFLNAVELAPELATAHQNLGHAYADLGKLELAIQHLRRALELNPRLPAAQSRLEALEASSGTSD